MTSPLKIKINIENVKLDSIIEVGNKSAMQIQCYKFDFLEPLNRFNFSCAKANRTTFTGYRKNL